MLWTFFESIHGGIDQRTKEGGFLVIWWLCGNVMIVISDLSALFSRPRFASDCLLRWSQNLEISFFYSMPMAATNEKNIKGKTVSILKLKYLLSFLSNQILSFATLWKKPKYIFKIKGVNALLLNPFLFYGKIHIHLIRKIPAVCRFEANLLYSFSKNIEKPSSLGR